MTTRCRFAPSPTGFFHIGSARTALFNWLFARHTGGRFILRIEDTDKERNREEFLRLIYDSLRWLGLDWDEGPEVGGDRGPYRQSERDSIYRDYLAQLRASGRAYDKDGAIWFRLEGERSEVFDEHRQKTVTKVKRPATAIDDAILGRIERLEDEDFVIVRSDGNPVFHFVNVVDDIAMGITHVIRGQDHLSNTSKHVELFRAFGAPLPIYAHIPLILKSDGPGKMSKRDRGALIEEYIRRAFVPEAVRNYLCLLGWSPKDDREKMLIEEIVALFDLAQVFKHNARFDERKMAHMNTLYLNALPAEDWLARSLAALGAALPAGLDAGYVRRVLLLCRDKIPALEGAAAYTAAFWTEDYPVDDASRAKIAAKHDLKARLGEFLSAADAQEDFTATALETMTASLGARHGQKPAEYIHTARLAVSGTHIGPSFYGLLEALGKERVLRRIRRFLASVV